MVVDVLHSSRGHLCMKEGRLFGDKSSANRLSFPARYVLYMQGKLKIGFKDDCLIIASAQNCLPLPTFAPHCCGCDDRNQLQGGNVVLLLALISPLKLELVALPYCSSSPTTGGIGFEGGEG